MITMKILDKFRNKNKTKNTINNTTTCAANQDKPECSLIEELRELQNKLQNKRNEQANNYESSPLRFCYTAYRRGVYGISIEEEFNEEEALKLLKDKIKEQEIYLENKKEIEKIDKRISEIKRQLRIK